MIRRVGALRPAVVSSALALLALALPPERGVRADEGFARPNELVSLSAAVAVGATNVPFVRIGSSQGAFVVPPGRSLVVTDYVCSPQAQGGTFSVQVNASSEVFTTQLTFVAASAEPSSFQVHLHSGMQFASGGMVLISLLAGDGPLNCYAYGYLQPAGHSHYGW